MSNIVIENLRKSIQAKEEFLKTIDIQAWQHESATEALNRDKKRLEILEKTDFSQTTNDMKAIMSHTKSVEEKYECRSVKGMFWLAQVVSYFSKTLGEKIQNYTVKEIHSPVCSIVSSPKPELPPMPTHSDEHSFQLAARQAKEREEMRHYWSLTNDWMVYKPTRWERFKFWLSQVKEVFTIRKSEPVLSEIERIDKKIADSNNSKLKAMKKGTV